MVAYACAHSLLFSLLLHITLAIVSTLVLLSLVLANLVYLVKCLPVEVVFHYRTVAAYMCYPVVVPLLEPLSFCTHP